MGAGASVSDDAERVAVDVAHRSSRAAHEAGELANASQTPTDNAFHDVADTSETIVHDVAQQSAAASSNVAGVTAEIVSKVGSKAVDEAKDAAAALLTLVPAEVIEPASALVSNVRHELSTEQLSEAAERLGDGLSKLTDSSAILVVVGSALAEVSGMAPAVIDVVGHALSGLGKHLGPIGVAAGFLGALVYTFQASKDQDKNVHTVMIWSASVKDWLLLVVQRVERSAAESTLPLFESLRSEMESMFRQIKKHNKRWRITKMLSSASFQRDFERAKTSVLELKGALKDFLNQEALDAQELKLKTITDTQLDVSTKLDTMDNQLAEIRAMLKVQADARDTATGDTANVNMDEEEQIYRQMQLAAGVEHDAPVKFKDFVVAFECFFFSGKDMDQETKRGLRIAIDRDCKGKVYKLDWVKFFRQWKSSNMPMEAYVAQLAADAPPTLCAQVITTGSQASAQIARTAAQQFSAAATIAEETSLAKAAASAQKAAGGAAAFGNRVSKKARDLLLGK